MTTETKTRFMGDRIADAINQQDMAINAALRESAINATQIFSRIGEFFAARRARRAAVTELSALDDRELADIGIKRSDIAQVARGKFPHKV